MYQHNFASFIVELLWNELEIEQYQGKLYWCRYHQFTPPQQCG